MDLPNTGAFVLPLAAHGFLVGLLVLEQVARPPEQAPCTSISQSGQIAGSSSSAGKYLQLQSSMTCDMWAPARHRLQAPFQQPGTTFCVWVVWGPGTCCIMYVAFSSSSRAGSPFPGAGIQAVGSCIVLGDKDREVVRLAGQVLAAACAMDLHSALQTAQAGMHSQQVIGLVEEVS